MTEAARALFGKQYQGTTPDEALLKFGVCQECMKLPTSERRRRADIAKERILAEARLEMLAHDDRVSKSVPPARIDLPKTLTLIEFPAEMWEWLDLMGHILLFTQANAKVHDDYIADTPYKQFLVRAIQCDIATVTAIYVLLRFELVHQAAAHVRLFCESVITLRYIAKDLENRLPQFLDYVNVEEYEIATSVLEQERDRAKPHHVQKLQEL